MLKDFAAPLQSHGCWVSVSFFSISSDFVRVSPFKWESGKEVQVQKEMYSQIIHISFCPAKVFTHTICLRDRQLDRHLLNLWGVRKLAAPWRSLMWLSMKPFWVTKMLQGSKTSHFSEASEISNSNVSLNIFEITHKKKAEQAISWTNPDHQWSLFLFFMSPTKQFLQMCPPQNCKCFTHSLSRGKYTRRLAQKNCPRHGVWRQVPWAPCVAAARWRVPPPFSENMRHFQSFPSNTGLQGQEEPPWRWRKAVTCWETPWRETWAFLLFWRDFFFPTFRKHINVWKYESGSQDGELVFPSGPGGAKVWSWSFLLWLY